MSGTLTWLNSLTPDDRAEVVEMIRNGQLFLCDNAGEILASLNEIKKQQQRD